MRPLEENDIEYVVGYFAGLGEQDCERMGVDMERLPRSDKLRSAMLADLTQDISEPKAFTLVWELDGTPIGMNTIKDLQIGLRGNMHLHMWAAQLRGQGHGTRFFCMAALDFFERFALQTIVCEPGFVQPGSQPPVAESRISAHQNARRRLFAHRQGL